MTILDKLRAFFSKENKEEILETDTVFTQEILHEEMPKLSQEPIAEVNFPHWLANEEALRDEGVLFGLSEANMDDKLQIISAYFNQKTAKLQKSKEELAEKIGELNLFIEKKHNELQAIIQKSEATTAADFQDEQLWRVAIGLLISLGMCFGNYFLIDQSLQISFPESHRYISWGVFLTGMFSLYNPLSVLHQSDQKLTWKSLLEEFGVPFAASLFVFVQVVENQAIYKAIALFVFVFFMFMVSGKILLSSITKLKTEWRLFAKNNTLKGDKKAVSTTWTKDKNKLEDEIEALRIKKWKIVPELNHAEGEINALVSQKETLIGLFVSEYNLAKAYKNKLSKSQISNILEK